MSDFFSFQNINLSKQQNSNVVNPILLDCDNPSLVLIVDKYLNKIEVNNLKSFISDNFKINNIKILFPFNFIPLDKEMKKQIENYYSTYSIDLKKYIPSSSKIITFGRSIYSVTLNTDFYVDSFYDFVFNKTYFYSSKLNSYIFPVDSLNSVLGYNNWNNYFFKKQLDTVRSFVSFPKRTPKINKIIVEDSDKFLIENMNQKEVSWDIETSGFNFMTDKIGCLTMSFDGITGYFLDWDKINKNLLNEFFENKYQIGANLKFDCKFLRHHGINSVKIDFDIVAAGHTLNEMRSNSLKTLSWIYTEFGGYEKELDDYRKKYNKMKYIDIPKNILQNYAIMDPIVAYRVYSKMKDQFNYIDQNFYNTNEMTLSNYYYDIRIPALNVFLDIEYDGVYVDWNKVEEISSIYESRISSIKEQIYKYLDIKPNSINLDSNQQIANVIKNKGWPCYGVSKDGYYLLNEDTLSLYIKDGYEAAKLIQKLHSLNTLMKTFVGKKENNTGYWQYRYPDNKIHSTFAVMFADSGRNKDENPNLQNIPKRGEDDNVELIRSYFCPPSKDYYIVSADMAGFQLRIGAALSGDIEMKKAFVELGGDLHSVSAATILLNNKITTDDFIKRKKEKEFEKLRLKAKGLNFSLEFNTSGISFAEETLMPTWTIEEIDRYLAENDLIKKPFDLYKNEIVIKRKLDLNFCKYWAVANDIKQKFFKKYFGLKRWIDSSIEFAEQNGYVKSPFGAIRRLPQLVHKFDDYSGMLKNLKNISVNSPVQNFEACVINMLLVNINIWIKNNNLKSKIFCMTHDSVDFYVYKDELKIFIQELKSIAEKDISQNNGIPMEIEWNIANYYEKNQLWGFGKNILLEDMQ